MKRTGGIPHSGPNTVTTPDVPPTQNWSPNPPSFHARQLTTFFLSFSFPSLPTTFLLSPPPPHGTATVATSLPVNTSHAHTLPSSPPPSPFPFPNPDPVISSPTTTNLSPPPKTLCTLNSSFRHPSSPYALKHPPSRRSINLTLLSNVPTNTVPPSLANPKLVTLPGKQSTTHLPIRTSYPLTLPSTLPAITSPSPTARHVTASRASLRTCTARSPLCARTSHSRTVQSSPPETSKLSFAPAKETALMRPAWEWAVEEAPKRRVVLAVATSQRRRARSPPAEAKLLLEREMVRERTA